MLTSLKTITLTVGLAGALACSACVAHGQPFLIGGQRVEPGRRIDTIIRVPAGAEDPATLIPVTVVHGRRPGPVLAIVAGVHGFEFAPILAIAELAEQIRAESLSGTLVLVRVAHVSAFETRSPYVNPNDRKNLNRSFPGDINGTQAERIAWTLSNEIVAKASFLIDVHSGDGAEWLESFVGVYGGPLATDYERALAVAEAFHFDRIVRYQMKTQAQIDRGRSLNRQAVAAHIPTVLVESGENGSRRPRDVKAIVGGITRTLSVLGMLPTPSRPAPERPSYFDGTSSVPVKHSGVWHPTSTTGRYIKQGDVIGTLRDYHGRVLETVTAPVGGYALYGLAGPPVRQGDSVLTIAHPVESILPTKRAASASK